MGSNNKEKEMAGMGQVSIISPTATITGEVNADNDLRIDGVVEGIVRCSGKVVVGRGGCITGDVTGKIVEVLGKIQGNVVAGELITLRKGSHYSGEITAKNIEVEPGAALSGTCKTGDDATKEKTAKQPGAAHDKNNGHRAAAVVTNAEL